MTTTFLASPLLERHRAAGAEVSEYFGVGLPAQFGEPAAEYRIAREAAGLIDTNFRGVFSLTGPDRVRYLNAVLTSNVRDLTAGQGTLGLLLSPQGHILAELETLATEDRLTVLGHLSVRDKTAQTLDKFIIMDDATFGDESAATGALAMEGPAVPAIARELTGVELSTMGLHGHAEVVVKSAAGDIACRLIHHSSFGLPGAEFLSGRDSLPALWDALAAVVRAKGGAPIGYRALNALRLEAGVPWFGADFDEHQIPHEAALEQSHISYTKGCYTGQEIVERVRSRGHVNRRRTGLQFDGRTVPAPGSALLAEGAETGHLTSAAFSPLAGKAIGMGYVRREHGKPGTVLTCGSTTATVIELPIKF